MTSPSPVEAPSTTPGTLSRIRRVKKIQPRISGKPDYGLEVMFLVSNNSNSPQGHLFCSSALHTAPFACSTPSLHACPANWKELRAMTLPRAPHPYKPPITSQGTSLLFCAMSITVIVYPSHRLEACFENRREKQYCCAFCSVLFKFRNY